MFTLMTKDYALEISQWTYPDIYTSYSFKGGNETLTELMNGEYYVAADDEKK